MKRSYVTQAMFDESLWPDIRQHGRDDRALDRFEETKQPSREQLIQEGWRSARRAGYRGDRAAAYAGGYAGVAA